MKSSILVVVACFFLITLDGCSSNQPQCKNGAFAFSNAQCVAGPGYQKCLDRMNALIAKEQKLAQQCADGELH